MRVREILTEGGWASTITQDVVLTPKVAKQAVEMLPRFEKDFNAYLVKQGLLPIEVGAPVGSSAYIERDLKNNPDKEYGDIDVLFKVPRIESMPESKNNTLYSNALADFITNHAPDYIFKENDGGGRNIIVKTPSGWVQVDLVKAFTDVSDWAQYRMTPEHNFKGALMGFLYSSMADALHLSLGSVGVQAKEKGGEFVKFKALKYDRLHTLSTDIEKFGLEVAKALVQRLDPDIKTVKIHPTLRANPGLKKDEVKVKDLAEVVKGIVMTLELNGVLGKGHLSRFSDAQDVFDEIKQTYREKIQTSINGTKFDKAATPAAKKRAEDTKHTLATKSIDVLAMLP